MVGDDAESRAAEQSLNGSEPNGGRLRFTEIDSLKVAGILAVILIHSLRAPWDPRISGTELWLGIVTRFAVPGFLFCSGFLYATRNPIRLSTVIRRLRRVLIPYLVCSIGAQIWWFTTGEGHTLDAIVWELLMGSSFGPFYYVFVHFFLVLFAPLFVLLPNVWLVGLTTLAIIFQGWLESSSVLILPIFWHIRNPMLWWGYFLLGWVIRLHHHRVRLWIGAWRNLAMPILIATIIACTWIASSSDRSEWVRAAMWVDIYAILAFIFVVTCDRRSPPGWVSSLSEATFAIYLLHLFFVYGTGLLFQPATNQFDPFVVAAYWSSGLIGAFVIIALVRSVFGSRSRDIIGA